YTKIHIKPPIIYSKIQILKYFYRNRLHFTDSNYFIETSKFSYFYCKLYFRYYPLRPVKPNLYK
ncbi:hypothetical protein EDB80DRAFT_562745, partial [Ilyonectria destructans]